MFCTSAVALSQVALSQAEIRRDLWTQRRLEDCNVLAAGLPHAAYMTRDAIEENAAEQLAC